MAMDKNRGGGYSGLFQFQTTIRGFLQKKRKTN